MRTLHDVIATDIPPPAERAPLELDEDITDGFIGSGSWEVDIVGRRHPVRLSLEPMYDPRRERIKA